jgi:hypothetical protein
VTAYAETLQEQRLLFVALSSGVFLVFGVAVAAAFENGLFFDVIPGVLVLVMITILGFAVARVTRLSLLPRFLILLYAMPFSALIGYLFSPDFAWVFTPHGYDIIQDRLVVREMIAIGIVGLCGLVAGVSAATYRTTQTNELDVAAPLAARTLGTGAFAAMVALSVAISWLSTPAETIFQKAYMTDQVATAASRVNFAAATLVSYILLVVLAIDIERDSNRPSRRKKVLALAIGVAYIIIVLQLLRGDRESSGLIVALAALYLTSPIRMRKAKRRSSVIRKRIHRLVLPMILAVVVYVWLGGARSLLVTGAETLGIKAILQFGLSQNTWTAVLWTNLGTAWEHRHGLLHYKLGQTYIDYLMSLPPGVISNAFGFERPLDAARGIVFEDPAGLSAGGLHIVIAPFKNFGMAGALLVLFLYGWLAVKLEIMNTRGTLAARLLWASTVCAGFLWFWYGDMPYVRALMMAFLTYWLYRFALSLSWVTRSGPSSLRSLRNRAAFGPNLNE